MIRTLLFLLLGLQGTLQAAPLLIHNVNGLTPLEQGGWQRFDALLIDGDRVLAAGSVTELSSRAPDWNRIDGKGAMLLPGFTDAHGHLLLLGLNLQRVDLRAANSLAETLRQVAAFARAHAESPWILGRGWNQVLWQDHDGRFPHRQQLDAIVSDRPVWLRRVDGHAGWANSRALALAGVDADTPDPAGGRIIRDAQGQPTGVLVDKAMEWVERVIPLLDEATRGRALAAALDHLHALGITAVHDAGTDRATLEWLLQRQRQGRLHMRVYAMLSGEDATLEPLFRRGPFEGEMLSVRSVKLYADGALGSHGAWLLEPYADEPHHRGLALIEPKRLAARVRQLAAVGWQVNIHAIGDRANREVLAILAALPEPLAAHRLRHRIEHAQILHPDDITRLAALGVVPSMQPVHATSDMNMASKRLGRARLAGAYAWRSLLDAGARIAAGSDFPVELANPLHGLYAFVTRQNRQGEPPGGWLPQQRIGMKEALRAFTLDAAWAAFQQLRLGSLEPGKQADFILLDRTLDPERPAAWLQAQVLETWVAGRQVYQRERN